MMADWFIPLVLAQVALLAYVLGWKKARSLERSSGSRLHSRPVYHGLYVMFWACVPGILLCILAWLFLPAIIDLQILSTLPPEVVQQSGGDISFLKETIREAAASPVIRETTDPLLLPAVGRYVNLTHDFMVMEYGALSLLIIIGFGIALKNVSLGFPARKRIEQYSIFIIILCSVVSILITAAILLSVLFEALRFFEQIPLPNFLFGTEWNPQSASGKEMLDSFGAVPLFLGTFLIMLIAMALAVPVGLFSAIYMAEYASQRVRTFAKPVLEILAGIPTVVYGYFAIITLSPALRVLGASIGLDIASESALVAGLVMGVMIIPFISSLSDDVITAVPRSLREASLGLGATRSETITKVVLPAALPGIMGAVLLGISRAIGETMIVVMAAGLAANLTFNPLTSVTTVTAQIVALLVGDQQFDSPKTLAAFALGLTLFAVTLLLNIIALHIVKTYRQRYE